METRSESIIHSINKLTKYSKLTDDRNSQLSLVLFSGIRRTIRFASVSSSLCTVLEVLRVLSLFFRLPYFSQDVQKGRLRTLLFFLSLNLVVFKCVKLEFVLRKEQKNHLFFLFLQFTLN